VHRNLGHYFAAKHGIETIIPDYRLVKHGGKYPSGGEDLALVLAYIRARYGDGRPLFIMGNSAGGVNAVSWLLDDAFTDSRGNNKVTGLISLGSLLSLKGTSTRTLSRNLLWHYCASQHGKAQGKRNCQHYYFFGVSWILSS
jgi:acetyl esterase/lipase